jgi:hypothetical protein
MANYLYEVTISNGRSSPDFIPFFANIQALKAKPPDHGGIQSRCFLSHHMDAKTVHILCTADFKHNDDSVSVTEVTTASLRSPTGDHWIYADTIENLFLRYQRFDNVL